MTRTMTRPHRSAHLRTAAVSLAAVLTLGACSSGADEPADGAAPDEPAAAESAPAAPAPDGEASDDPIAPADGALTFTAATVSGGELDVSTLAGTPVVLWFWAPWCTVCRGEAPDVSEVAAELDGEVTFLGVAGLGPVTDMQGFVQDTGTGSFEHLADTDGSLWGRFSVISQPAFAFVAPDGAVEVVSGALGADGLRERATALLDG